MKRDEVGADRRDFGEDRHHPVIGGERRFNRLDARFVGGEGVAQGRGGCFSG